MKYTAVSVRQLDRKGKPWQARAKYKDVYGKWKEVSKMLPEAKGKKEANRMAKEWLDQLNAEADLMPNAGKAKTVDEIYKEYLLHQVSTGEIERSTYTLINSQEPIIRVLLHRVIGSASVRLAL